MNIDTTAPVVTRDEILLQAPFGKQTLLAEIAILDELLDTHSIQRSGTDR